MTAKADTITTLGTLLRPTADKALGPLAAWLAGLAHEDAMEVIRFVCDRDPLIGGYSRMVVRHAMHASKRDVYAAAADLIRTPDPAVVAQVEEHLARRAGGC